MEYWYDDNFLVWGNQTIKNKQGERGKKKQDVFYFYKVGY